MRQFLAFEVADRRVALPAEAIQEVVRAVAISRLPKAPPVVEGVINVRGTLVPALDIRARFRLPPEPLDPGQHLIIARAGSRTVALRVDRAVALVTVDEAAIAPGSVVPGAEHVAGIARLPDGVLVIHDLERFLSLDEAGQLDEAVVSGMRQP